jgi:regulator of protease activity HflC (stomatin/prohibitin superfamily)
MTKVLKFSVLAFAVSTIIACSKVPAGNVGIKVNLLGGNKGVDVEELGPGRVWVGVNEELFIFPTFTQTTTWEGEEQVSFQTVEGMVVKAPIGLSYSVVPDKVNTLFQKYRKGIDEITDLYLRNMVRDALVSVASTQPIESVYGAGKAKLIEAAQIMVQEQVKDFGLVIEKLYWAGDLGLPPEVTQSLNNKIKATQMAQQRENEIRQAKAEAEKQIAIAKGEADSRLLVAEAETKALRLKGSAILENPRIVELSAIEKWDGKLPQVSGSATPFISLPAGK